MSPRATAAKRMKRGYKTAAWQRKAGKSPKGGLNAAGRASYKRQTGGTLRAPSPNPKTKKAKASRKSFCARMKGMKAKRTKAKTANDPNSDINKSLRRWNC